MGNKTSTSNEFGQDDIIYSKGNVFNFSNEEMDEIISMNNYKDQDFDSKILLNDIMKQSDLTKQTEQTEQTELTDFQKFENKIKFLIMCRSLNEKPTNIKIEQINSYHVKKFAECYNFVEYCDDIEVLMPNKLQKIIKKPFIWPFDLKSLKSKSKETKELNTYQKQVIDLKKSFLKRVCFEKVNMELAKSLFGSLTRKYNDIFSVKEEIYLYAKLHDIDIDNIILSYGTNQETNEASNHQINEMTEEMTDKIKSFLKLVPVDTLLKNKVRINFEKLSLVDKLKFIQNSTPETYSYSFDVGLCLVVFGSLNLTNDKSDAKYYRYVNFLTILFDTIYNLNYDKFIKFEETNFQFEDMFRNNKFYQMKYDEIRFEEYKNVDWLLMDETEQKKNTQYFLSIEDQYELYKLNEKVYVKMLCSNEQIIDYTFKPYEINDFRFLDGFNDSVKKCLEYKIKLDTTQYMSTDNVKYPELNTVDDLIDYLVFTFDPPKFLYKKDLLDVHPLNIKLMRECAKYIDYDQSKYSYKNYKPIMSLAPIDPSEVEDIAEIKKNYKNNNLSDEELNEDLDKEFDEDLDEDLVEDDEELDEDLPDLELLSNDEKYIDPLQYKMEKAKQYFEKLKEKECFNNK